MTCDRPCRMVSMVRWNMVGAEATPNSNLVNW